MAADRRFIKHVVCASAEVVRLFSWVCRIAPSTETHHRRGLLDTSIAAVLGVVGGLTSR